MVQGLCRNRVGGRFRLILSKDLGPCHSSEGLQFGRESRGLSPERARPIAREAATRGGD